MDHETKGDTQRIKPAYQRRVGGTIAGFVISQGEFLKGKANFRNKWAAAAVFPIVILIGRCVGEMLPWSSPENIGRSFTRSHARRAIPMK
jgi:hypothetical protein